MAVQTISTTGEIPKVLEKFYSEPETGLLPRGISEIFPKGLTGAEAYAQRFQPLIEQGLVGAGYCRPDVTVPTGTRHSARRYDNARSVCFG
jgi:hypothetical protein